MLMFDEFLYFDDPRTKKDEKRNDDEIVELAQALALYEQHLEDNNK
jgi:hypothetical protein